MPKPRIPCDRNGRRPSPAQRRQRQLARMVWIAEGAEANFCSMLSTNADQLTGSEFREINRLRQELLTLSRALRNTMKGKQ